MTTSEDRFRSLKQSKKLLEELCDPGKTPRVPSMVRDRARAILKHYPNDKDFDTILQNSPEILEKRTKDDKLIRLTR